jgi:hypothetical protein
MQVPEHEPVPFPNIRRECEPGQVKSCGVGIRMPTADGQSHDLMMHCMDRGDGVLVFNRASCATPLVVTFDPAPVTFTKPAGSFTVGPFSRTEWVSARTPWLALDRDGNGAIDSEAELFRFDRLRDLDDNHDGRIDEHDDAYRKLVLWFDRDQDRRSSPSELVGLADARIVSLQLDDVSAPNAVFGSHEGERADVWFRGDGALQRGRIVDVYLAPMP